MTDHDTAAGADAPAAHAATWVDWRDRRDRPAYSVTLWPNRSLGSQGRRTVLAIAAVGLAIPLLPALGTPVFWGLLPFEAVALGCLWWGFRRNDADARLSETLTLWPDELRVERIEPSGRTLRWQAFPAWVRLTLHEEGGPVENYLTMRGAGREIELGRFLSPDERTDLKAEIEDAINRLKP